MENNLFEELNHEKEHGDHQSPINIDMHQVKYDPSLRGIHFEHRPSDCLEVLNKGSTWSIKICSDSNTKLTGTHLPGTYRLAEVHAHWGERSNDGSEHLLANQGFAAEIHMVHYNEAHGVVDAAKKHGDGLAVLGIFLQESQHDNPALEPLIQALKRTPYKGQTAEFPGGFDLTKLLPGNRDFCTYCGSLTTPPYTECVVWTVFAHPIPISRRQLDVFRSLNAQEHHEVQNHDHAVKIINNARAAQEVGNRKILASFPPTLPRIGIS